MIGGVRKMENKYVIKNNWDEIKIKSNKNNWNPLEKSEDLKHDGYNYRETIEILKREFPKIIDRYIKRIKILFK